MKKLVGLVLALIFASTAVSEATAQTFTVGPQTGIFTGNTRGYFFTAPTDFTITSLFIPTDASVANQYLEVVRFAAAPPIYASTTNAFTSLGYFANQASGAPVVTSINVFNGDIIGILGSRGNVSSYGAGPYTSTIFGQPVTIERLGFQAQLQNEQASGLFTESGRYSRINFTYAAIAAAPEPATWAMLIAGFGMAGGALRRRRGTVKPARA